MQYVILQPGPARGPLYLARLPPGRPFRFESGNGVGEAVLLILIGSGKSESEMRWKPPATDSAPRRPGRRSPPSDDGGRSESCIYRAMLHQAGLIARITSDSDSRWQSEVTTTVSLRTSSSVFSNMHATSGDAAEHVLQSTEVLVYR